MKKNLKENELFILDSRMINQFLLSEGSTFNHVQMKPWSEDRDLCPVLLMRYVDNHLCEEYFTNKKIQILDYENDDPNIYVNYNCNLKYFGNEKAFKKFQELHNFILNYPLCFELNAVQKLDKNQLSMNGVDEYLTKNTLNRLENTALEEYKESFNKLLKEDYNKALAENMIYEMKKRTLKKGK